MVGWLRGRGWMANASEAEQDALMTVEAVYAAWLGNERQKIGLNRKKVP